MKFAQLFTFGILSLISLGCQDNASLKKAATEVTQEDVNLISSQVVEVACGECQFGMPGEGCDLAVKIEGKTYYVDGSHIDDHGDAHGKTGLCNCKRKAKVSGELKKGRFQSTSFKLLPLVGN